MIKAVFFLALICSTFAGPQSYNFFNPLPKADPAKPPRQNYVPWTANTEIWRLSNAIMSQGQDVTEVYVYGKKATVTKVACLNGAQGPCYKSELEGTTFTQNDINSDKHAFVNMVTRAINMGIIIPNHVKGTNTI